MAVWEVRVVYQNGDRFWENVWHVDIGAATDVPPGLLAQFESFAIATLLDIYSVARIVRRPAGTSDAFIEELIGAAGALVLGSNKVLPLWNTVRVLLNAGAGRPGIKFLRGILTQASITDEQNHIDSGTISLLQTELDALFNQASDDTCTFVIGADDKPAVSPVVQSLIQMRQPHRKRKKPVV